MRTVTLLGKGTLAVKVGTWLRSSHDFLLSHVVPVWPEPEWTESLYAWARTVGVPVIASGDYREAPPSDLVISIYYDKILSADWINVQGRVLNLHNGALPRYRGVNPLNWALKNRETYAGVTLHEVTPGIDDGPIVAQVLFPIWHARDDVRDIYLRALTYGWTLMQTTLPILHELDAVPQDEGCASYYSKADAPALGDYSGWMSK